ncbi:MAG: methyltransferase domain-containing protein [Flavobacterium sp.]|nr:methyltransferase domain-containing protein [Flavobacterium sp.]
MKYINLGCGPKYSKDKIWVNADMNAVNADVIECNFINGIAFNDNEFNAVYHSHVIEHFNKNDAEFFISECFRILKKDGIIRIACPNLEVIAKEYLKNLERAINEEENGGGDYDWILLEMYDQTVRNKSGGEMLNYFRKDKLANLKYVITRIGNIAQEWHKSLGGSTEKEEKHFQKTKKELFLNKFLSTKPINDSANKLMEIGKFRLGGEIHQWMYDRFSLTRLLEKVGFQDVIVRSATESYIPDWKNYELDSTEENASIFIEAKKY